MFRPSGECRKAGHSFFCPPAKPSFIFRVEIIYTKRGNPCLGFTPPLFSAIRTILTSGLEAVKAKRFFFFVCFVRFGFVILLKYLACAVSALAVSRKSIVGVLNSSGNFEEIIRFTRNNTKGTSAL